MGSSNRFPAVLAYLPVVGWVYVLLFQQENDLAKFHLRQSIGVFVFLLASFAVWAVVTWMLSWIPFGFLIGVVLFTLVITAVVLGVVAWVMGIIYAWRGRVAYLPIFGKAASRIAL